MLRKLLVVLLVAFAGVWFIRRQWQLKKMKKASPATDMGKSSSPAEDAHPTTLLLPCPQCGVYVATTDNTPKVCAHCAQRHD